MHKLGTFISGKAGRWVILAAWIVIALVLNLSVDRQARELMCGV